MAIRGVGVRWYDGFFLSMLAFSMLMLVFSWTQYNRCKMPFNIWIAVDYGSVFLFRLLMFLDNWISSRVRLDYGRELTGGRLFARMLLITILYGGLYPSLFGDGVLSVLYGFRVQQAAYLPDKNQKWGFLLWLVFSFCGLICLAGNFGKKWLLRRQAHVRRTPPGSRVSEPLVLLNMIRQPDWVYEVAAHEARVFEQEINPYNNGMNNANLRAAVQTAIEELPVFILNGVPPDCSDCPICLEEFAVGQGVRGLPCAHSFHVACIDKWLILNSKCPRCRCIVFPFLHLNNPTTIPVDPDVPSPSTTPSARSQPSSSSYLARMQSFFMPAQVEEEASPSVSSSSITSSSSSDGPDGDAEIVEVVEVGGEPSSMQ